MSAIEWVLGHWEELVGAFALLVALASAITKLTPSKKDDVFVASIQELLGRLSLLNHQGVNGLKAPLAKAKEAKPQE